MVEKDRSKHVWCQTLTNIRVHLTIKNKIEKNKVLSQSLLYQFLFKSIIGLTQIFGRGGEGRGGTLIFVGQLLYLFSFLITTYIFLQDAALLETLLYTIDQTTNKVTTNPYYKIE